MSAVRALVLAAVLVLLVACSDGGLSQLEADPVVRMEVPGARETDLRTDRGGQQFGKRTPARVFRLLELNPEAVFDTAVGRAQEAGWQYVRAGLVEDRTARLQKTVGDRLLSLYVDLSDPPLLQLDLSTA